MRSLLFLGILTCLISCRQETKQQASDTIRVSAHPLKTTLYFSGTLQPFKTAVVTSPSDGVIQSIAFHYGDRITVNQPLFTLTSEQFQKNYKTSLTDYIKAKTDFLTSDAQLKESKFLYTHELISKDDYNAKKTNYYTTQLAFVQAKDTLGNYLQRLDTNGINPYRLKISEIEKITQALQAKNGSRILRISSPKNGIILLSNSENGGDSTLKQIREGSQVKQGDVLAIISDLANLIIRINVSEFNINQLNLGDKVLVRGAAFPDYPLAGEIIGLNHQGIPDQSGLPVFPVEISVHNLTEKQQSMIHIGMSVKVAIDLQGTPVITVPIRAVSHDGNDAYVQVQDEQSKKIRKVMVKTGVTTLDSVVIQSDLKSGDYVVIPREVREYN